MEEHKLRYLQYFLRLASLRIEDCVNLVRTWEAQARSCYAETVDQTSDEFTKMILVDGRFVVMVIVFDYYRQLIQTGDRLFYQPYLINDVTVDMALIENQLPFFVIKRLYNFVLSSTNQTELVPEFASIRNLVYAFFKPFIPVDKPTEDNKISRVSHFVDFIRLSYQPTSQTFGPKSAEINLTRNASHLHAAGVKFEGVTGNSPMDIEFADGVLKIPHLKIDDDSEIIFRNLVAFEQLHSLEWVEL